MARLPARLLSSLLALTLLPLALRRLLGNGLSLLGSSLLASLLTRLFPSGLLSGLLPLTRLWALSWGGLLGERFIGLALGARSLPLLGLSAGRLGLAVPLLSGLTGFSKLGAGLAILQSIRVLVTGLIRALVL